MVDMDLEGIDEIDVFRVIQRCYEHHLAEAEDDDGGDDKGKDNSDDKKKKGEKKREAAIAEAKNKVAGLIRASKRSF